MANPKHLEMFDKGWKRWNSWRKRTKVIPDLSRHDFSRRYICNYDLSGTLLSGCNLEACHFQGTSLIGADLRGASLKGASIDNADFTDAVFGYTTIDDVILSSAKGLGKTHHRTFSSIDYATLKITANLLKGMPNEEEVALEIELFLRSAGVPDEMLALFRKWSGHKEAYYSCFISYSWKDKDFADALWQQLTTRDVTCWLDSKDAVLGSHLYNTIDQAIRQTDKVLLCCSQHSLNSWWVDSELDRVMEKERALIGSKTPYVLIPLDLDGYLRGSEWINGKAATIRTRLAGDFRGWNDDPDKFAQEIERLMKALRRSKD